MASYISEVLADSPDLLFLLNEPAGTLFGYNYLESPDQSHVTVYQPAYIGGPTLGSVALIATGYGVQTGSSSYVEVPRPAFWSNAATIEFWFKYVSGSAPVFSDSRSTTPWKLDISGTHPVVSVFGAAHTLSSVASSTLKTGRHHIVFEFLAPTVSIYIDGSLIDSWVTSFGLNTLASKLVFGKDGLNAVYGPAVYAAVALYGHALGGTRVAAHYAAADRALVGPTRITVAVQPAAIRTPGTARVRVAVQPNAPSTPTVTRSGLVLASSTVAQVDAPPSPPTIALEPLHIVSPAVPAPTLVNGRPT